MSTTLLTEIATFVAALAGLILIHEFGHYVAARMMKIEVEEFGLGFPPRLATLFTWGGTRFSLNWIPLGGFVRPKGENDPNIPGGLAAANPWKRLFVLFAGPFANLFIGILLFAMIYNQVGVPVTDQVQIQEVVPDTPAAVAGLLVGDLILEVDGVPVKSTDGLHDAIYASLDQPITMIYSRDGQTGEVTLTPRSNPPAGQGAIGILMGNPTRQVGLFAALPMGTAAVFEQGRQLLAFPVRMIQGQIAPEEGRLVGLKGMFDIYQEVRQTEPTLDIPRGVNIMAFFATISISLGVLNLLPIPALDGGRILFTLPEIILRRRIPPQYENVINMVSFALLLVLLLFINLQDFINPVTLP
jgi:regulator of sigma E protease